MNDNLRYISLQYIKGDNYEDIASFKDDIKWVLTKLNERDELDNTEAVEVLYSRLKEAREEKNKKIGESFLDDLINYSSFNLYKKGLKEAKEIAEELMSKKRGHIDILTKLIALYSSYLNICTKNILKYDRLFEHNEISNIDEAFMIRSYSDFLKKLNKLKENLETKDKNKIMRALMNSLEKLFNMYGINTNNEAAMKAFLENVVDGNPADKKNTEGKQSKEVDYIIERIINYNLNM